MLTSTAVGFIRASAAALIRCRVSGRQLDVERHEVAPRQQLLERQVASRRAGSSTSAGTRLRRRGRGSLIPNPCARRATAWPIRPNPTIAERRAVDIGAQQQHRTPRPPAAVADVAVALGQPSRGGHQQRPGQVGGRLGQDARRVADGDPPPGARRDVDVVEADGVVADDLELRPGGVEELVVDPVREQRQDAVAPGDPPQQLVPRRRQLVLPDVDARRPRRSGRAPRPGCAARRRPAAGSRQHARRDQRLDHAPDAAERLGQVLLRVGVRDPDVVVAVLRRTPTPASTQTPASCSRRSASSAPDSPVPAIDGKT